MTILTRGRSAPGQRCEFVHWDGRSPGAWARAIEGADAIVHLSGKRVDCRPTRRNLNELIASRVDTVRAVGNALETCDAPPPVWVRLSSLAIFGDGGDAVIDEATPPSGRGPAQMVQVCLAWEAAFAGATAGIPRTVLLRAGIGIGGSGDPATDRLAWLVRRGLGGRAGTGTQWVSWVALDDFLEAMVRAIDDGSMAGLYHVTSPNPITNAEMMATYRELLGRRVGVPAPAALTYLGAILLGSDPALALTGRRCVPARLLEEGFEFSIPTFPEAVAKALAATG
ncbi:MAG: DUF1731 domain-containing protein [Actinobacteria bacterium]|nr:DUF1731 domain-containing protein [Actinomycetota bacterium]